MQAEVYAEEGAHGPAAVASDAQLLLCEMMNALVECADRAWTAPALLQFVEEAQISRLHWNSLPSGQAIEVLRELLGR